MKKLLLIGLLIIVGLFCNTGCSTNNFCNIDRDTLYSSAEEALREDLKVDFESVTKDVQKWKTANPDGTVEQYQDYYIANNPNAINKKSKAIYKSCITTKDLDADKEVTTGEAIIRAKTWSDALKQGPIELLFVFPMAMLIIGLATLLGGSTIAKFFAIILATFVIRFLVIVLTWKSTKGQYKMQEVQPEIAKIQAKYAGLKDQQSRAKMQQDVMKIYSKHGVNPLGPFLSIFVTFPIFISMWGAVQETSMLQVGEIAGVILGKPMSYYIVTDFKIFALVIFVLMTALQIISMKLTSWLQALERKKKHQVLDPKTAQQMKQTNMVMNIMMIMIVFVGWSFPIAMSVYWLASNLFTIGQTLLLKKLLGGKRYEKVSG